MAVGRKFIAYDAETINEELLSLSKADFLDLTLAMEYFQNASEAKYTVKNYDDGLMMIKGNRQGRCLWFFKGETVDGIEILIVVLVYKKETQRVPSKVLETARSRMAMYREKR